MELIENFLQLLVTFLGACLAGFAYWNSRRQQYFLLLCFYGCFALGALYRDLEDSLGKNLDLLTTGSLDQRFLDQIAGEEIILYDRTKS